MFTASHFELVQMASNFSGAVLAQYAILSSTKNKVQNFFKLDLIE
jgi:hypothetical protein